MKKFTAILAFLFSLQCFGAYVVKNGSVTTVKLATGAVTNPKIATGAVTSTNLGAAAVTTASIGTAVVTQDKLATRSTGTSVAIGGVAISASCGIANYNSTTPVNVSNLSVTLVTTGRPVFIGLISDGATGLTGTTGGGGSLQTAASAATGDIIFLRNGTAFVSMESNFVAFSGITSSSYYTIDPIGAGTYIYSVQIRTTGGLIGVYSSKLIAYEL
jgi:hypothetical protein